jgi:hypothetical protein
MKSILTSILFGFFAIVSPVSADEPKAAPKDIVDTAVDNRMTESGDTQKRRLRQTGYGGAIH